MPTSFDACRAVGVVLAGSVLAACSSVPMPPVKTAWYDDAVVRYITTETSDAAVARAQGVTFAPRLRQSLLSDAARAAGQGSALDKVYVVTNATQPTIFASAPSPVGPDSTDLAYTPLWRMVTVRWRPGHTARELRSEEAVLAAEQAGEVALQATDVVLNCPILQR